MTPTLSAAVDRLLLQFGELDFQRLLSEPDLLDPAASASEIAALIDAAHAYAARQGLRAPSGAMFLPLAMRRRTVMRRPAASPQLDLLRDDTGRYAETLVRDALLQRQVDQAAAALARVSDREIAEQIAGLVAAARELPAHAGSAWMERDIEPLARARLGQRADAYLAWLWVQIARSWQDRAFESMQPLEHASHAWLQADEPLRACDCIEAVADWQQSAPLSQRRAQALSRAGHLAAARSAWMQLCWQHPQAAEAALDRGDADASLRLHWQDFRLDEGELAVTDFPSWMLLADPGHLAFVPAQAAAGHEQATGYAALHELLLRKGEMSVRRRLQALRPDLLQRYLQRMVPAR